MAGVAGRDAQAGDAVSDASDLADKALHEAVDRALDAYGFASDQMLVTDIAVLVTQRGFDESGGVSRVVRLVITDTPHHALLGMLASTRVKLEREVWESADDDD